MNKLFTIMFVSLIILSNFAYSQIKAPESVLYNDSTHTYLVTDAVAGKIFKLDTANNISVFTTGLTSPKGIVKGMYAIWVTDVDKIIEIEPETGEIIQEHKIDGALALNDIVADDFGYLYISDLQGNKIYKYDEINGTVDVFASNLIMPNGLYYDYLNIALIVVSFGQTGIIYAIDLVDGSVTELMQTNLRLLDGIAYDTKRDKFYISTWGDNSIYSLDPTFLDEPVLLKSDISGPADIYYNENDDVLAVPSMNTGKIIFIDLSPTNVENNYGIGDNSLQLYPNPVKDKIYISNLINYKGDIDINIYNTLSQTVMTLKTNSFDLENGINISDLPSGVYFLTINYHDKIITKQFVK